MLFLGLSALAHDTSAALLSAGERGDEFLAAIEESKLVRARQTSGIPRAAIRFCLEKAQSEWADVAAIAIASRAWRAWSRQALLRSKYFLSGPLSSSYYESRALGELAANLNNERILRLLPAPRRVPLLSFDHHLCHAASAFFPSPFERALILTFDEQGDGLAGSVAVGEGRTIRTLREIHFPNSLGWLYSQMTELLGFRPHEHEHKTQWLSLTAEPELQNLFLKMMRRAGDRWPKLNSSYFRAGFAGRLAFSREFFDEAGISANGSAELDEKKRAILASSFEKAIETVLCELAEALREEHHTDSLCLAGGLFLNPLIVSALEKRTGFANIFVQPAAGNEGAALGAAWLARRKITAQIRRTQLRSLYLGPAATNEEIKNVLDNCKAAYRWLASDQIKIAETVKLLEAGKIAGWFHGATEFGPRALGNRSLLASPWSPYVKENLNEYVKHREPYRPFALSVPRENAGDFFEFTPAAKFMASMGRLRPEKRELLAAFALPGDLVRLHVVERGVNPLFWELLKIFGAGANAPILLNASFNLFGEPLVATPRQAVRSYFCSGMDALVIGNFLLAKS